jgi:hypothetical protein
MGVLKVMLSSIECFSTQSIIPFRTTTSPFTCNVMHSSVERQRKRELGRSRCEHVQDVHGNVPTSIFGAIHES